MYIYKITNITNNKVYVGQTKLPNVNERWKHHLSKIKRGIHSNTHLQFAWNKYGESNFKFEILENVKLISDLDTAEIKWINHFDSMNKEFGYNKEGGGNINKEISQETKEKIAKSLKGKYKKQDHPNYGKKHTDEHKRKLSIARKLRVITVLTREKLSKSNLGRIVSRETKQKIKQSLIGHKVSESTRKIISDKNKLNFSGEKHPMFGKTHSSKSKKKMSDSARGRIAHNRKMVLCIETNIEYESALKASQELNLPSGNIYNVLIGKRKRVHGFSFKYI